MLWIHSMHLLAKSAALLLCSLSLLAAAPPDSPPDLTQNPEVDRKLTYNLGPTGLRGWIYTKPANFLDSQLGRTTTASRQILVTHVGPKSPADGVFQVNDVILGVGFTPFSDDARKSLGAAITDAEKSENGGILTLLRWRAGISENVQIKLAPLGSYSETAPFRCPKSTRILDAASRILAAEPLEENLWGAVNALALLSTGIPDHLPKIRDFARKIGPPTLKLELKDGMVIWDWGYRNLFLSEYYLVTGDEEVLHAIREYTLSLAKGQSLYGTFGHGIAPPSPEGLLHGSIPPYGPVNAAGLVANLSIVLGQKCGIDDPEIDAAIARASHFFGYYVDKGAIPYGEHTPWPNHENNGKNAMAALMFASQGNRVPETRFFAKMVTASFQNREYGHTGQGFSYLWGALGANAGGPAATAAFFNESAWHLDLVRRSDGSFTYDGGEQYGPGKTHDDSYYGKSSYYGLSPNATYVLTYSLPLKKLLITGRDANPDHTLSATDVAQAVSSGKFHDRRPDLSISDLTASLGDWSPAVRGWAAEELASRPGAASLVPQLIALAESDDVRSAQGASETLGLLKAGPALPALVRLLSHPDRWLRFKAAQAIDRLDGAAKPAIPEILAALARTAEPPHPINWADPLQFAHGQLANALFSGPLADAVQSADPKLLYPAIRTISRNPAGMARATLRSFFDQRLSLEDVTALAPDILEAVLVRGPADTMFGNEIRMGGFKALAKFHFKEAITAGVAFAKTQGGHGSENRTGEIMREIVSFGTAAKDVIPQLEDLIEHFNAQCARGEFPAGELNNRRIKAVEDAIQAIASATAQPELREIPPAP